MQFLRHPLDFGIADIDSIEEGEEEKDEKWRHHMAVDFPEKFLLCDWIYGFIEGDFLHVLGMRNLLFFIDGKAGRMNWAAHSESLDSQSKTKLELILMFKKSEQVMNLISLMHMVMGNEILIFPLKI